MSTKNVELAKFMDADADILADSLENLISGLGTELDKRAHGRFRNSKQLSNAANRDELEAMYRTDWFSGKVVDIIPEDMTREWRRFSSDELTPEQIEKLEDEEKRLGIRSAFYDSHKWGRLYGGAMIFMVVDDGLDPRYPLDIDRMQPGQFKHIKVFDRHFVHPTETLVLDPMSPSFGLPRGYRLAESSVEVHHTRVIRFDGVDLPLYAKRRNNYWADSVLDRLYNSIINANTIMDSAASMVEDTNVDVVKVRGMMNYLSTNDGTKLLQKRFMLDKFLTSFVKAHIIDADEDYTKSVNTFAGLPDLVDRALAIVSGASDIPATRFLSKSPDGLNATGDGDMRNYYDKLGSQQEIEYRPKLAILDKMMAKNIGLDIKNNNLKFKFNPLYKLTEKEQLEADKVRADRDAVYWDRDIVPASSIAKDLKQRGIYENIPDEHIKHLEELEKLERDNGLDNTIKPDETGGITDPEAAEEEEGEEGAEDKDPPSSGS